MRNSCIVVLLLMAGWIYPQRTPKIKGNREVTEIKEELQAFNAIELDADLDVELVKADTEGYGVVADDNLLDILKFEVKDSTLFIGSYYKITAKKRLEITVFYNQLERVVQKDGLIMAPNTIISDVFSINLLGNADMQLTARASLIDIVMESNARGDLNVESDSLHLQLKDKIDARVYVIGETGSLEMFNDSKLLLEGTLDSLAVGLADKSVLKGKLMESRTIVARMEDSSSAEVRPVEHLELNASGASRTDLYGSAKISIVEFLDMAELRKRRD